DWPVCGSEDWALNDAIDYATSHDVVIVGASGNFSENYVSYPANHPAVIAVGATTITQSAAAYSNRGAALDLVAPGGGSETVDGILQESFDDSTNVWGVYAKIGTSFSSPLVAGTAALMRAANPTLSSPMVRAILLSTALDLGTHGWDPAFGAGLLQAQAAVTAAATPLPPTTVVATIAGGPVAVDTAVADQVAAITGTTPERLAGANRYATAAAISAAAHTPGVPLVYVTTGMNYPDAISIGPVAALADSPVLLVVTDDIPGETLSELSRLSPERIVIIGGPAAVSDAVATRLAAYATQPIERLAGHDRYGTATEVSRSFFATGSAHEVFIATGHSSPDALASGTAATASPGPILLTRATDLPAVVNDELVRLQPDRVVIVGGIDAVSLAVEQTIIALGYSVARVAGSDRYGTSALLSQRAFPTTPVPTMIATGENFPDALTATSYIGARGGSLLLTRSTDLPAAIAIELNRLSGG
ncbi:MAG: cell wall-binding repeat-containing protein, partial [Actinomycetota bacterium]|nr:cell wall-binding repeat-containing protein [Actinomycetota bacterium]